MNINLLAIPLLIAAVWANEHGGGGGGGAEPAKEGPKGKAAAARIEIVEENESGFVAGPEVELDRDVKIPKVLVEKVEELFETAHHNDHDALQSGEKLVTIPRQNLDLRVYFNERSSVLKGGSNIVMVPPTGGGVVDLSRLIRSQRGTFFWHVQLRPRLYEGSIPITKVYFLSRHVRKTRDDGPAIGVGCEKVVDLSSHFTKVLSKRPGEKLNTTADAHLGTLLGTYYFFVIDAEAVRVATLSFKDPAARKVACD